MGSFFTDKTSVKGGRTVGGPRRRREGPAVSSNLTARVRLELDVVGSCADGRRPREREKLTSRKNVALDAER